MFNQTSKQRPVLAERGNLVNNKTMSIYTVNIFVTGQSEISLLFDNVVCST